MRADRLITLWLARLYASSNRDAGVLPILMYHSISREPEPGVHPYYQVRTHPEVFARHMAWLAAHGYRGVDLETGLQQWSNAPAHEPPVVCSSLSPREVGGEGRGEGTPAFLAGRPPQQLQGVSQQPRPVAITFDDGFQDVLTEAWPVLARHGFTASVFLPTAFIGEQRRCFQNQPCLTWNEVRDLRRGGLRFGSHTVHHGVLYGMDWPQIQEEIKVSKQDMEQQLGERVTTFAYPYAYPRSDGAYVSRLSALLRESGYECCVTTRVGRARQGDSPCTLKRLPANSLDDDRLFEAKLAGAYDWVGPAQHGFKTLQRWWNRTSGVPHGRSPALSL